MNNSEIHKGLENSEIRDFLAKSLILSHEKEANVVKLPYPLQSAFQNDTFEHAIVVAEQDVFKATARLTCLKEIKSIITLIKNQGWNEWDVSDETAQNLNGRWMSFIGTEEEYKGLLKRIKKESDEGK